jgi:uncharacterized NAD(P)/FAD-binding protein YdhS
VQWTGTRLAQSQRMELTSAVAAAPRASFDPELRVAPRTRRVVIVGGGFAGAALAYHLLQHGSSRLRISLIEPGQRLGRGVAYGVGNPLLRLNVPASRMSIDPKYPHDFVSWAGAESDPQAFLPRSLYGAYVSERLSLAAKERPGRLRVVRAAAIGICRAAAAESGEVRPARAVQLEDGRTIYADHVVLATGLSARRRGALPRDRRVLDAWDERSLARLPQTGRILLLGSGLSALDVLRLLDAGDHRAEVVVMSRHGLLPRPHAKAPGTFAIPSHMLPVPTRLPALIRWTRELIAEAHEAGASWQSALDALRPITPRIWQSLPPCDRQSFVEHVRPYWEVLRHRAPLDILERLDEAQVRGAVQVRAGRMLDCRAEPDALRVVIRDRSGELREDRFAAIVRCLGPSSEIADAPPLLAGLLRDGEARLCTTRLGITTGEHGRLIDASGRASDHVFALGQLCRASRWETTSAPDIVRDAVALAELLSSGLDSRDAG